MNAKGKLLTAMLIWGSLGLFVKNIALSSPELAFFRALLGCLFLCLVGLFSKKALSWMTITKMLPLLILSGAAISINWIFLFQAYKYTTVPIATLSYYFAPVFIILISPLFFKERLTFLRLTCVIVAMLGLGLILLSGQMEQLADSQLTKGIGYGILAAAFYASVVVINKFLHGLSGYETTLIQLTTAVAILGIYIMLSGGFNLQEMTSTSWLLVIIVGIMHTGIAFLLFFSAIPALSSQTLALLSYVDPISAMIFAALFLHEGLTPLQLLGGILVLGAACFSEWQSARRPTPSTYTQH